MIKSRRMRWAGHVERVGRRRRRSSLNIGFTVEARRKEDTRSA
jgi:hypothetical protein